MNRRTLPIGIPTFGKLCYEGYYASVFYSYFAALGLDVTVEYSTSHGRLDMAVEFNDNVFLFEFKVVELAGEGAAGTPTSTATSAGRSTSSRWSSARTRAMWSRSRRRERSPSGMGRRAPGHDGGFGIFRRYRIVGLRLRPGERLGPGRWRSPRPSTCALKGPVIFPWPPQIPHSKIPRRPEPPHA